MIKLKSLLEESLLDRNAILYLGWVKRNNLKVVGFDIESGESETHYNYLMGLPPEWRNEMDNNLVRWRYRNDINTLYWWDFGEPTEDEKKAVEVWIQTNLGQSHPAHRLLSSGKQASDPHFWKSHGEDE
jgi:hypothetical protein